jgi:HEAT repeat protein
MCFSPAARFLIVPALSFVTVTGMFAQSHSSKAWEALNRGLEDSNPAKRIQTIVAMSVIQGETQPVAAVEKMLNDKDSGVREAACTTLGEMRSRSTIPKLQRTLNDNAPEVAFAAAKALYAMGNATGREVLIAVVQGDQPDASGVISTSMREMRLKLHDPKALIMLGIAQGAGFLGPFGAGVPIAERLMKDNQASGKTAAVLLLATDTTEGSKSSLRQALKDKNWTVRAAASHAVALRHVTAAYPDLTELLDDKRDEVRYSAAAAMIRLKQPVRKARPIRSPVTAMGHADSTAARP